MKYNLNLKKLILFILTSLFMSGCAHQVTIEKRDDYLGIDRKEVSLALLPTIDPNSFLYELSSAIVKEKTEKTGETLYYLQLFSYSEMNATGKHCPSATKGSRAIFLVGNKKLEKTVVKPLVKVENCFGVFFPSCKEAFDVGPFTLEEVKEFLKQNEVKFKIYGEQFAIEAKMTKKELETIKSIIMAPSTNPA